ncbi:MAG: winged helix-turn-helix domain-containing protein, partial [Candidatus Cybelea sp.]
MPPQRNVREPLSLEPLFPDRRSGEQLCVQLTRRLRSAIESGAFPIGTRLLGTRQLAKRLGLGRNTVALAFEQLTAEGYLATRTGSGTVVAAAGRASAPARPSVKHVQP